MSTEREVILGVLRAHWPESGGQASHAIATAAQAACADALLAAGVVSDAAAEVESEHVGGCNERCGGGSHWFDGRGDLSAIRGLTSLGAARLTLNGERFIRQDDLIAAVDAHDAAVSGVAASKADTDEEKS